MVRPLVDVPDPPRVSVTAPNPEQLAAIDGEVKAAIQDAVEFAESSPLPDPNTVLDHVEA